MARKRFNATERALLSVGVGVEFRNGSGTVWHPGIVHAPIVRDVDRWESVKVEALVSRGYIDRGDVTAWRPGAVRAPTLAGK